MWFILEYFWAVVAGVLLLAAALPLWYGLTHHFSPARLIVVPLLSAGLVALAIAAFIVWSLYGTMQNWR